MDAETVTITEVEVLMAVGAESECLDLVAVRDQKEVVIITEARLAHRSLSLNHVQVLQQIVAVCAELDLS